MSNRAIQRRILGRWRISPEDARSAHRSASRRLTAAATLMMAVASFFAVLLLLSGEIRWTPVRDAAASAEAGPSPAELLSMAKAAEEEGDVAKALARYRDAVRIDPRIVDKRAPEFLGEPFEGKIRLWIAGMRDGRIKAGPDALRDASYLFRRMYGGCG